MVTFELSDVEEENAKEWLRKHLETCATAQQIVEDSREETLPADSFAYLFIRTTVGIAVHVQCRGCHNGKDVSDYNSW